MRVEDKERALVSVGWTRSALGLGWAGGPSRRLSWMFCITLLHLHTLPAHRRPPNTRPSTDHAETKKKKKLGRPAPELGQLKSPGRSLDLACLRHRPGPSIQDDPSQVVVRWFQRARGPPFTRPTRRAGMGSRLFETSTGTGRVEATLRVGYQRVSVHAQKKRGAPDRKSVV